MSKYGGTGLGLVISKHSLEQLAHLLGRHSIPVSATASVIQSRTSLISRKEKIATPAPTTARPLIPRKASSNRLETPSRDGAHARIFGLWDTVDRLDLTRFMSATDVGDTPTPAAIIHRTDMEGPAH